MAYGDTMVDAQPPAAELVMRQGPSPGQSFSLTKPLVTIGRGAENDVAVADHQVSRRHASLTWDGASWSIEDLGSANGTYVNGVRLTAPQILQDGDTLGLGPGVQFAFQAWLAATGPSTDGAATFVGAELDPLDAFTTQKRGWRRVAVPLLVAGLVLGCVLVAALAAYLLWPREADVPIVLIHSPQFGEQVAVGREVTVQTVARDEGSVTRLELWVDEQLQEAQDSTQAEGVSPFPLVAFWQPSSPGPHTLIARAFNAEGGRAQASVNVEAIALPDGDGDGVPDNEDLCPDEAGSEIANGCLDADDDGIADAEDACPDEPGFPEHDGCPGPDELDGDSDGLLDDEDDCPDEPGTPVTEGCPDADGDAIPDARDACPDEPGSAGALGGDGCPAPAEGDRDGDGISDAEDACPDQAGSPWTAGCPDRDGDSVRDGDDACPDVPGSPDNNGCPEAGGTNDLDGDGVSDPDDDCPNEEGAPQHAGCPDRDSDGIPDDQDRNPDEPGGTGTDTGVVDTDGDGLDDERDACPEEEGLPEHDGCPPPTDDDDADGDGTDGDQQDNFFDTLDPPGFGDDIRILVPVEFQALEFEVDQDYDEVYCYASLAGSDMERYGPFDPTGERRWDIAADLGSQLAAVPEGEPLELRVECGAYNISYRAPPEPGTLGAGGESATYWDLGSFSRSHPRSDWTGEVFEGTATGPDGHSYRARYRVCADTCERAAFPPPMITLRRSVLGRRMLQWRWEGDRSMLDGYRLFVDGSYVRRLSPGRTRYRIRRYAPSCGERREFYITAYSGSSRSPDRESPPSNVEVWEGEPCPRTVRVTFDTLRTGSLGTDEHRRRVVGPIEGGFRAIGSNAQYLPFDAVDYPDGYTLRPNYTHSIQEIFDWIRREQLSCLGRGCPEYDGPDSSSVIVELGPDDALEIGGIVHEQDRRTYTTLFNASYSIAYEDIVPGPHEIRDGGHTLTVLIDVISGPGASEGAGTRPGLALDRLLARLFRKPDLTVTGLSSGPRVDRDATGQLRIHVFNGGEDLVDQDLSVRVETLVSRALIETIRYENVTIPAGESHILGTTIERRAHDTRVIIDPEDEIDETNEDNNEYETPVRMRVEFLQVWTPFCNEWSCSVVSIDAEFVYYLWAGHGPDVNNVDWVAHEVRFPASGQLRSCCSGCEGSADARWVMAGDRRYTFEVDVPFDQNLYVMVTGKEIDGPTADDGLGAVRGEYGRSQNWGARPEAYEDWYGRPTGCDDPFCQECRRGLWARWYIERLH